MTPFPMVPKGALRAAVALTLAVACGAPALAADKQDDPKKTPAQAVAIERLKRATPRAKLEAAQPASPKAAAQRAFEQAEEAKREAEQRRRAKEIEASREAVAARVGQAQGRAGAFDPNARPDPATAREQAKNVLPVQPPASPKNPFAGNDPQRAREEANQRLLDRVNADLAPEKAAVPDPRARTLPPSAGVPGFGGNRAERLKQITGRIPGSTAGPKPYDGASLAKGKRPIFRLQHSGGGEGVYRCHTNCAENGYQEGEMTDKEGLPDNAIRDDVNDMTTTQEMCRENPALCDDAKGGELRRPGESDEDYWDRRAKQAYRERKARERKKLQAKASADCSKIKSTWKRESCEFDKKMAQQKLDQQKNEQKQKADDKKKEEEEKKKQEEANKNGSGKDCAVGLGAECDGLPDDELVRWHRENQQAQIDAARGPVYQGSGNVDPERGPRWHEGLDEQAVEILGVDDPPEDETAPAGGPQQDCSIAPGAGAIDMGPDHVEHGGNPGCETDTPSFDSGDTLDLDSASDDDEDEDDEEGAPFARKKQSAVQR